METCEHICTGNCRRNGCGCSCPGEFHEAEKWVLKDGDNYFKTWTGIGPAGTEDVNEAAVFATKQEAMQSPAFSFALMSYSPTQLETPNPEA